MSLPIIFRDEARREFDEAVDWYGSRQVGLGADLTAEVQRVLDFIAENPKMFVSALSDVRKATTRRFPYSILYRSLDDCIEVIAVFHASRDPSAWQRRT
jgi:toxin ParE1/3/4